jgi:hypothetical protein
MARVMLGHAATDPFVNTGPVEVIEVPLFAGQQLG